MKTKMLLKYYYKAFYISACGKDFKGRWGVCNIFKEEIMELFWNENVVVKDKKQWSAEVFIHIFITNRGFYAHGNFCILVITWFFIIFSSMVCLLPEGRCWMRLILGQLLAEILISSLLLFDFFPPPRAEPLRALRCRNTLLERFKVRNEKSVIPISRRNCCSASLPGLCVAGELDLTMWARKLDVCMCGEKVIDSF